MDRRTQENIENIIKIYAVPLRQITVFISIECAYLCLLVGLYCEFLFV